MKFTKEQLDSVKRIDIVEYLGSQGYELINDSKSSVRLQDDHSIVIDRKRNLWNDFSSERGGDIISLVEYLDHTDFVNAVYKLLNVDIGMYENKSEHINVVDGNKSIFTPPEKDFDNSVIIGYLTKIRCIDVEVVYDFIEKGILYQSLKYKNCVFVSLDENKIPRSALLRGTFGGKDNCYKSLYVNSYKDYGLSDHGFGKTLYVFESPIDLMSYKSLYPTNDEIETPSYLSMNGLHLEAIKKYVQLNKHISCIYVCVDNDKAGDEFYKHMYSDAFFIGYNISRISPQNKDFNVDLSLSKTLQK